MSAAADAFSPDRIARRFADCAATGRAALVTFITAGDPDLETSARLLAALPAAGADVIELGVPFTDPMADGASIQLANLRALAAGISLRKILALVSRFRAGDDATPIVLMGYLNPIHAYGVDAFVRDARAAGVDGIIVVDLPPEESAELSAQARAAGLHEVRLATPTTDEVRQKIVCASASGFLYYVSVAGVTGGRSGDVGVIGKAVDRLRAASGLPVAVGFGIRTPENAASIARVADGVVVGSAIVDMVANAPADQLVERVTAFVGTLAQAVRTARSGPQGADKAGHVQGGTAR